MFFSGWIVKDLKFAALITLPSFGLLPWSGMYAIFGVKFNIFIRPLFRPLVAIGIAIPLILCTGPKIRVGLSAIRDVAVITICPYHPCWDFGVLVITRAGVLQSLGLISINE